MSLLDRLLYTASYFVSDHAGKLWWTIWWENFYLNVPMFF